MTKLNTVISCKQTGLTAFSRVGTVNFDIFIYECYVLWWSLLLLRFDLTVDHCAWYKCIYSIASRRGITSRSGL